MTDTLIFEAISFAARAHRHQLRKDGQTPYVAHAFRVCFVVRHVFEIDDRDTLLAAILHDTIEDTTTDYDDLAEQFGAQAAGWAAALSKDKRLPEDAREREYCERLQSGPWQVTIGKLADLYDNLSDVVGLPAEKRARSLRRSRQYLDALAPTLPPEARNAWDRVEALFQKIAATYPPSSR